MNVRLADAKYSETEGSSAHREDRGANWRVLVATAYTQSDGSTAALPESGNEIRLLESNAS